MSKEMLIRSWKDPFSRSSNDYHPAGNVYVELEEAELNKVIGAGAKPMADSSGVVCTITTECSIWPGC